MPLFGPPNVEKLKYDLHGLAAAVRYKKDAAIRAAACKTLATFDDLQKEKYYAVAVRALTGVSFEDPDLEVRLAATEALGAIYKTYDRTIIDHLSIATQIRGDPLVRQASVKALVNCAAKFQYNQTNSNYQVVADALLKFEPEETIGPLVERLKSLESRGIKQSDLYYERRSITAILARIGVPSVDPLKELIFSHRKERGVGKSSVVYSAIACLGEIHSEEAKDILADLTQEELLTEAAFDALAEAGDCRSVPYLISTMDEYNPSASHQRPPLIYIIEKLGKLEDPRAVEPLIKIAVEECIFTDVQHAAQDAIVRIGHPSAVTWLVAFLTKSSAENEESIQSARSLLERMLYVAIGEVSSEDLLAIWRLKDGTRRIIRTRLNQIDESEHYYDTISLDFSSLRDHAKTALEYRGINPETS